MAAKHLSLDSIFADVLEEEGGGGRGGKDVDELDQVVKDEAVDVFALAKLSRQPYASASSSYPGAKQQQQQYAVMESMQDVEARFEEEFVDRAMAREFPFELDAFQKEAILHLERGEHVFVSAHTSAGKTVVAEYAFALAMRNRSKAIYTSPIKTISNQKFRDFHEEGFEVGILTGDVSIHPEASCLIMTTEILRSMLYRGADVLRDVEWVIFDEVHYVNDIDRGVVWEEVIIMLPKQVNMVLLSATVPNTFEFADWIGRTKQRLVYVTGTNKRPVPLEHLLYYAGDLYKICENEEFLPDGYKQAKLAYKEKNDPKPVPVASRGRGAPQQQQAGNRGRGRQVPGRHGRGQQPQTQGNRGRGPRQMQATKQPYRGNPMRSERNELVKLIGVLKKKELLPAVFFVFSKKKCEGCAEKLESMDLSTGAEKAEIHQFFDRCMSRLSEEDRQLPQLVRMKDMLKRGMAVHHAGLLPIVKEVVEILFCRGLIKVLFSTETFAMGVNAPARVCVFHSLEKHDGREFRSLLSGEYTQMAGRAGRRGIDSVGTVIIMCWDEIPMESALKHLLTGKATKLQSQFRLRYNMILNVFRVDDMKMEDMLKRSFAELNSQRSLPYAKVLLEKGEQALRHLEKKPWPDCYLKCTREDIRNYWRLRKRSDDLHKYLQDYLMASSAAQHALGPGRVVVLKRRGKTMWEPAVLLASDFTGTRTAVSTASMDISKQKGQLIALVLLSGTLDAEPSSSESRKVDDDVSQAVDEFADFGVPLGQGLIGKYKESFSTKQDFASMCRGLPKYGEIDDLRYGVLVIRPEEVLSITKSKIRADTADLLEGKDASSLFAALGELRALDETCEGDIEVLDPVHDLKMRELEYAEAYVEKSRLQQAIISHRSHRCPRLEEQLSLVEECERLDEKLEKLRYLLSDENLQQAPEFKQRMEVLRTLHYIDEDGAVQLKGRVACEINTGDELLSTELILRGVLSPLCPAEAVALLSALVFQEKSELEPELPLELVQAQEACTSLALEIGWLQKDAGMLLPPEDHVFQCLNYGLVEVVYAWAKGEPFAAICERTDVMEGAIVRTVVRLDETCREFASAGRILGDDALVEKMEAASQAIKRDVVFAASLYVQ